MKIDKKQMQLLELRECVVCGARFFRRKKIGSLRVTPLGIRRHSARTCSKKCSNAWVHISAKLYKEKNKEKNKVIRLNPKKKIYVVAWKMTFNNWMGFIKYLTKKNYTLSYETIRHAIKKKMIINVD